MSQLVRTRSARTMTREGMKGLRYENMSNTQQRLKICDDMKDAVDVIIQDSIEAPGMFRDGSVPLWRRLFESIEELLKHKLLRDTRRARSGDPGVVLEGLDDEGLPPERSDLFVRFLDTMVQRMLDGSGLDADWQPLVRRCLEVSRDSPLPPGCAELGWGRGRLLLFELLRCGQLGRVTEAINSDALRPLIFEVRGWKPA